MKPKGPEGEQCVCGREHKGENEKEKTKRRKRKGENENEKERQVLFRNLKV